MTRSKLRTEQSGAIAIFLVVVLGILLLVSTTTAARLNVSELNQSSQVDRSDQAYYAAEAGVEEASRRLDHNPAELDLKRIFPEQYDGTGTLVGDMFALVKSDGSFNQDYNNATNAGNGIRNENGLSDEIGQLSWRDRRVYAQDIKPTGTIVKDQSIQLDTTALRRNCPGGGTAGSNGVDCNGTAIFTNFQGIDFCWSPVLPPGFSPTNAKIELTVLSYSAGSFAGATPVRTEKFLTDYQTGPESGAPAPESLSFLSWDGVKTCFEFRVDQNRRYIFRTRLLINGAVPPVAGGNQNTYAVNYDITLKDGSGFNGNPPLYLPDDTLLIDVVGQSGPIRRRIVAQKRRNGQIHGIFDFVLYQGDKLYPLCKAGVQQNPGGYNTDQCIPVNVSN